MDFFPGYRLSGHCFFSHYNDTFEMFKMQLNHDLRCEVFKLYGAKCNLGKVELKTMLASGLFH